MAKVILQGTVNIPKEDLDKVIDALPQHIANTKSEKGCIVFNVGQDKNNKYILQVYEEFIDEIAFRLHQKRVADSEWGALTARCTRHYTIDGLTGS